MLGCQSCTKTTAVLNFYLLGVLDQDTHTHTHTNLYLCTLKEVVHLGLV